MRRILNLEYLERCNCIQTYTFITRIRRLLDEIFEEVRTDVKEFKVQYVNHLSAWHSNKDQEIKCELCSLIIKNKDY